MNFEEFLDARVQRRIAADDRAVARIERKEKKAEAMIGQLMREGRVVYYVHPASGKYREGSPRELMQYLIRARHV